MNEDYYVLNFTPTGMVPTKKMTANIPISTSEIIEEVHAAYEAGITLVHLHARDENGFPTYKARIYQKLIEGIKLHCKDLVIGVSLSGRNFNEIEKRSEVLSLQPDMASLTLSSMNFAKQASINDPEMITQLCEAMGNSGTNPELEVFDLGMINYSKYLISKNFIKAPFYYNILLGNISGLQLDPLHIGSAISNLPKDSIWSIGGLGKFQLRSNLLSLSLGGGVRIGLEDNIYYDRRRTKKASNLELIGRIHRIGKELDMEVMPSKEFGNLGFYNKFRNGR